MIWGRCRVVDKIGRVNSLGDSTSEIPVEDGGECFKDVPQGSRP